MRILAFSDLHGSFDAVEKVLRDEVAFDAVVIGGDLTTHGTSAEACGAVERFQRCGRPLVVVAGNMDPPEADNGFAGLGVSINARGLTIGDAGFFGVSASPFTPFRTPYEISEEEIRERAEAGWAEVSAARWKVFVPHAPPARTALDRTFFGKHVGSTAVREFIEARTPHVVVCGHIHEARGTDTIGATRMVNCGQAGKGYYAVVTLADQITVETRG